MVREGTRRGGERARGKEEEQRKGGGWGTYLVPVNLDGGGGIPKPRFT